MDPQDMNPADDVMAQEGDIAEEVMESADEAAEEMDFDGEDEE